MSNLLKDLNSIGSEAPWTTEEAEAFNRIHAALKSIPELESKLSAANATIEYMRHDAAKWGANLEDGTR